jgi:hypothetical protein
MRYKLPRGSTAPCSLHFFIPGVGERRRTVHPGELLVGDEFAQFVSCGVLVEDEELPVARPSTSSLPKIAPLPQVARPMEAVVETPVAKTFRPESVVDKMAGLFDLGVHNPNPVREPVVPSPVVVDAVHVEPDAPVEEAKPALPDLPTGRVMGRGVRPKGRR